MAEKKKCEIKRCVCWWMVVFVDECMWVCGCVWVCEWVSGLIVYTEH